MFCKKVYFTGGIDYLDKNFATDRQQWIQRIFFRLCNLLSNNSILVSTTDVENVKALYHGKLPRNCVLNFHSIDVESFVFDGNFQEKKNNYCTIAWMANIDNVFRKGVDKALNIFAEIAKTEQDAMFYIAGMEGEGSEYVMKQIEALSLQKKIVYLRTISEDKKIKLLKESKYYFQLSKYEGFGIATIEALSAGCVVIHSGRGGLRDAVGKYGYKVDIEKPVNIEKLLMEIKEKANDIDSLKEGIQYVHEKFSMEQRKSFFKKILNGKK
ncbi:glycosyl transferase [Bacteroidia bacterium]|nr:glycosyl transferase [Bacteroidia bacterium]